MRNIQQILSESFVSNAAHAAGLKYMGFGYWGDGNHATHKTSDGRLEKLPTPTPIARQPSGNLGSLPDHWKKEITEKWRDIKAGDSSPYVKTHEEPLKSESAFKKHLSGVVDNVGDEDIAAVILHINGTPAGMITSNSFYGRKKFSLHNTDPATDAHRRSDFSKGDALDYIHRCAKTFGGTVEGNPEDKDFFKRNKIEVHAIGTDMNRKTIHIDRNKNTKNPTYPDYDAKSFSYGNLLDIKKAAAEKLVNKKLGDPPTSSATSNHLAALGDLVKDSSTPERVIRAKFEEMLKARSETNSDSFQREHLVKDLAGLQSSYSRQYGLRDLRSLMNKKGQ